MVLASLVAGSVSDVKDLMIHETVERRDSHQSSRRGLGQTLAMCIEYA